jgi:hypothetical protein
METFDKQAQYQRVFSDGPSVRFCGEGGLNDLDVGGPSFVHQTGRGVLCYDLQTFPGA